MYGHSSNFTVQVLKLTHGLKSAHFRVVSLVKARTLQKNQCIWTLQISQCIWTLQISESIIVQEL